MKKNLLRVAVFATTSLFAVGASADPIGVNLGLRTGYAIALGDLGKGAPLSDFIKGAIPVHLDATYAITKEASVGLYFGYGFGMQGDRTVNVGSTIDSLRTLAYGLQANMAFPSGEMVPWVGVFGGLERLAITGTVTRPGSSTKLDLTSSISGWQAGLQGGADWKVADGFTAGPYASVALGRFGSMKSEFQGSTTEEDIPDDERAMHQWVTVGVRGTFGF